MSTNTETSKAALSASPKTMRCNCNHKAQDELHGEGFRVHNPCPKKSGPGVTYRCTVCKNEK